MNRNITMCTWEEDLIEGERIEHEFGELLLTRNPGATVEYSTGAFSDYDLILTKQDGTKYRFEVKFDRMSRTTGNVAIEISCNGHPSGLWNSIADYCIYYINDIFYSISRDDLIAKVYGMKTIMGGDGYRAELVLVPKETFISRCTKIGH